MKKIISMMTCLIGFSILSFSQSAPAKVSAAFKVKFPKAVDIEWNNESDTEWEADFEVNEVSYTAVFLSNGTWQETKHEINTSELPVAVTKTLASQFDGYDVIDVIMVEKPELTEFNITLENDDEMMDIVINKSGKVVEEIIEEDYDEEED